MTRLHWGKWKTKNMLLAQLIALAGMFAGFLFIILFYPRTIAGLIMSIVFIAGTPLSIFNCMLLYRQLKIDRQEALK